MANITVLILWKTLPDTKKCQHSQTTPHPNTHTPISQRQQSYLFWLKKKSIRTLPRQQLSVTQMCVARLANMRRVQKKAHRQTVFQCKQSKDALDRQMDRQRNGWMDGYIDGQRYFIYPGRKLRIICRDIKDYYPFKQTWLLNSRDLI